MRNLSVIVLTVFFLMPGFQSVAAAQCVEQPRPALSRKVYLSKLVEFRRKHQSATAADALELGPRIRLTSGNQELSLHARVLLFSDNPSAREASLLWFENNRLAASEAVQVLVESIFCGELYGDLWERTARLIARLPERSRLEARRFFGYGLRGRDELRRYRSLLGLKELALADVSLSENMIEKVADLAIQGRAEVFPLGVAAVSLLGEIGGKAEGAAAKLLEIARARNSSDDYLSGRAIEALGRLAGHLGGARDRVVFGLAEVAASGWNFTTQTDAMIALGDIASELNQGGRTRPTVTEAEIDAVVRAMGSYLKTDTLDVPTRAGEVLASWINLRSANLLTPLEKKVLVNALRSKRMHRRHAALEAIRHLSDRIPESWAAGLRARSE